LPPRGEAGGTMSDLVSLLYRADWARLSLTTEVNVTRDRDLWRSRYDDGLPSPASERPFGPWSAPWFGPWFGPPQANPDVPGESWESPEDVEAKLRFGVPGGDGREWELATEVLGRDFQPDIPAGMRVAEEPDYPPGPVNPIGIAARQAVKEARSAVNSFLSVIRGENAR
jgi:hypothetical protein